MEMEKKVECETEKAEKAGIIKRGFPPLAIKAVVCFPSLAAPAGPSYGSSVQRVSLGPVPAPTR